jgi:hypothetical protein
MKTLALGTDELKPKDLLKALSPLTDLGPHT